ncbi:G-type lectin S-receptor-like serine/threonine-protein kinase SD2-5 [Coffea arabica]|uniref:Receptor-like serine/threonine-protein kinase n=1 Tax=Coffea arabica TaxID=13443 RepID=A0A6P6SE95_COFAR|nr:G-type lectin S-receptor-like serine/threonine-protein kinase SD2-5 [Coffea arabica]
MFPKCWNFIIISVLLSLQLVDGQPFDYPTANLSTTWINSVSANHSVDFTDGSKVRAILLRGTFGPRYACGFFCNGTCDSYMFAIFIVQTNSVSYIVMPSSGFPQVVWSANRNNPVKINATLQLTSGGDLVLRDADGTSVWSTNTRGRSVAGLNLTEEGNLVLFDMNNLVVWQSFDHPTDALVPGQKLVSGQKLTASASITNSTEGGLFSMFVNNEGLFAAVKANPPQIYYQQLVDNTKANKESSYAKFQNGSLALYIHSSEPRDPDSVITLPQISSAQYMKLGSDGHLRLYEWADGWKEVFDILAGYLGDCNYPTVCGENGICSNGQCSCPRSVNASMNYFTQINGRQPNLGCSEITPLNCNASRYHNFLELKDMAYFTFNVDITSTNMDSCKQACLGNCSCKAAIFRYGSNSSNGDCYLPAQIFSLMNNEQDKTHYNSSVFMKVQITPNASAPEKTSPKGTPTLVILGYAIAAFILLAVLIGLTICIIRKKRLAREVEEGDLDNVPGMPTRFPFEDLKIATANFSKKLGEGGFGSVFEGSLGDGTKVAVKCLDGIGQVKKSFLAEVESIGSIHHVNLVRLVGFCAEKSHRLLVYELMSNGSLEKWIYRQGQEIVLDWKCRRKIVLDIAKGLTYLHEDCRQKIIHLDIKPQNILLDDKFNAKLSDFGLSKLIDRDQSQVVTTMRGTPGYLAPEWLSAVITEKVDVYSFGVVVLEILCGRKIVDRSEPEERMHLLSLFKQKAEEGKLMDMIDQYSEDMQSNREDVVKMMQVAAWCLQSDHASRPSMSVVVKVLEGVMDTETNLDYGFERPSISSTSISQVGSEEVTALIPSVLSGPR